MSVLCLLGSVGLMAVAFAMTMAIPGAALVTAVMAFVSLGFSIYFSHIEGGR